LQIFKKHLLYYFKDGVPADFRVFLTVGKTNSFMAILSALRKFWAFH